MLLTVLAAGYGGLTGLLVPRAAYRLSVGPEERWHADCPEGHPVTGPAYGWLGLARCAAPDHGQSPAATGPRTGAPWYGRGRIGAPIVLAVVCGALAAAVGGRPELAVWLLIAPFAVVLAMVDGAVHRLPDVLTLPLAAAAVVLLGVAALLPGHAGSWTGALLGGLALTAFYFLLFLIHPNGMGFGDVKLALSLGALLGWYGWTVLVAGAFAGLLLGSVYGVGLILLRGKGRKTAMPFGPFMIGGALLGLLLGGLVTA
nr:A24 family peptidase [Streptomyces sp. TP-A0874]